MKRLVPLLLLITLLGCRKTIDVDPADSLYQRWQWQESRLVDQRIIQADSTRPTIITFKPSGEYVYEYDGKQFSCCQPNRFTRTGNQLFLSSVRTDYASPECVLVSCAPYQPELTIESLSAQQLVLIYDGGQIIYKPVR